MIVRRTLVLALVASASACTSFSTVRSAVVPPGPNLLVQASVASPPGDAAAWFWNYDCAQNCDRIIPSADILLSYGNVDSSKSNYALGVGVNGLFPYIDGYLQLRSGRSPLGIGGRLGLPATSWTEHQLYMRVDRQLSEHTTLLWNPGIMYHTGNSPNGENPGRFLGFVQGVGLTFGDADITPSVALVLGRTERSNYGVQVGPRWQAFATGAVSFSLHPNHPKP